MDKPFEFDLNEEVVISRFQKHGLFKIRARKHGSKDLETTALLDFAPDHLSNDVKTVNRYKLIRIKIGYVYPGWYRESDLARSVLRQLMRARRSSCE